MKKCKFVIIIFITITKNLLQSLNTRFTSMSFSDFQNHCQRRILKIPWTHLSRNWWEKSYQLRKNAIRVVQKYSGRPTFVALITMSNISGPPCFHNTWAVTCWIAFSERDEVHLVAESYLTCGVLWPKKLDTKWT